MAKKGSAIAKTSKLAGLSYSFYFLGWVFAFFFFLWRKTESLLRQWPFFNVLSKPFSSRHLRQSWWGRSVFYLGFIVSIE
ncbi:MAG: hypothetical protein IKN84_04155 [Bacteroidales bacterium]|nr:hypothetical protein [Bacteroidales bacterium]